jgi:hypothetical protein
MRATNFTWRDSIYIHRDGEDYDLHNNFNVRRFIYDPAGQLLILEWELGTGDWVSQGHPRLILLRLQGVTQFSFKERDTKLPFSEDDCLASFGYASDEDWVDSQFWVDKQPEDDRRWSFIFQSGAEIEVSGDNATIEISRE